MSTPPSSALRPSVLIGGIGSLPVAAVWMLMFPGLRRLDRFEPAEERDKRV